MKNEIVVASDGEAALAILRGANIEHRSFRPDLVLLDLNLPKLDGRQVLAKIKEDPDLKRIPVVILTTSQAGQDILRSYDLQANAYIIKPVDFDQFVSVIRSIEDLWLTIVKLPTR